MKRIGPILGFLLCACSPITSPIKHQYQLNSYSSVINKPLHRSLFISQPIALAGYKTEKMMYTEAPFSLASFAYNTWSSPPADMIFPLIIKAIQESRSYLVVTSTNAEHTDYRLDTELVELKQNFLKKPSELQIVIKVVLSDLNKNKPISSKIMSYHVVCKQDTPYGGVLAANSAVKKFTEDLVNWIS